METTSFGEMLMPAGLGKPRPSGKRAFVIGLDRLAVPGGDVHGAGIGKEVGAAQKWIPRENAFRACGNPIRGESPPPQK